MGAKVGPAAGKIRPMEQFFVYKATTQCATDCGPQNVLRIRACVQIREGVCANTGLHANTHHLYMAQAVF